MRSLSIDIETFSSVSLAEAGVYAYCEAVDFTILLLAYGFDQEEVQVIDLAQGETLPAHLLAALTDEGVRKTAYHAQFERACLSKYLGQPMSPNQWQCTAVHGATLGLPGDLQGVCVALGLGEEQAKSQVGKALIQYFSVPCTPTQKNGGRTRNLPTHDLEKWELFKAYCKQDVVAERTIREQLGVFPLSESEQKLWELDQKINETGIGLDGQMVEQIITYDKAYQAQQLAEAKQLTGLANPKSVVQLKNWLSAQGLEVEGLSKVQVAQLIGQTTGEVRRVLTLRQAMSKTSIKKYEAMKRSVCQDGRIRGTLQFYGANRTGRWSGRLVQVHNLPQNKLVDLEVARAWVKEGDFETLALLFGETSSVLSQLVRTALVPRRGYGFVISDFSAIEARVIAWLADERWRLEVFASHGKIYEASASQMFGVPLEAIGKGSELRQKGKVAELACGYGGGVGALKAMGAEEMGLEQEELEKLIQNWRRANPHIVALWGTCEQAARQAIEGRVVVRLWQGVTFSYEQGILFVRLPSGRRLAYYQAELVTKGTGKRVITYFGVDQQTKKWGKVCTYGGKLTENIVQAIARDCLAEKMKRLDEAGYILTLHVHDEVILEVPKGSDEVVERVTELMSQAISWARGLPLRGETYEAMFYKKD